MELSARHVSKENTHLSEDDNDNGETDDKLETRKSQEHSKLLNELLNFHCVLSKTAKLSIAVSDTK
jgi:hypothetical protein